MKGTAITSADSNVEPRGVCYIFPFGTYLDSLYPNRLLPFVLIPVLATTVCPDKLRSFP